MKGLAQHEREEIDMNKGYAGSRPLRRTPHLTILFPDISSSCHSLSVQPWSKALAELICDRYMEDNNVRLDESWKNGKPFRSLQDTECDVDNPIFRFVGFMRDELL
jgi:hypothetical protein